MEDWTFQVFPEFFHLNFTIYKHFYCHFPNIQKFQCFPDIFESIYFTNYKLFLLSSPKLPEVSWFSGNFQKSILYY